MTDARMTNWAGNVVFGATALHRPTSVEQLQEIVAGSERVRALGTGHSFSRIADTTGDLVSVAGMPRDIVLGEDASTVTVSAGLTFGEVAEWLDARGHALPNLGSLPHISVAGAVSTGTHGSGDTNGCIASTVQAVELVTADGALRRFSRASEGERFDGMALSVGALGIATTLTLSVIPTFDVAQRVLVGLPLGVLAERFDEVFSSAYSISAFTDWRSGVVHQLWVKDRVGDAPGPDLALLGATPATEQLNCAPGAPARHTTPQLGVPGPWHERLPHFRMDFSPSSGNEQQSEYYVARADAAAAIEALLPLGEALAAALLVAEIRTVAADSLWLSPAHGQDCVGFHFTWRDDDAVRPAVALLERALEPLAPRPHWGKVFTMDPDLVRSRFPRLPDFAALAAELDPAGKLRNEFVDRHFAR